VSSLIERRFQTRMSALWAAYGDAIGFISELTDERGLRRRTKGLPLTRPLEWSRRVGGRAGVTVSLPAGCYSDDTQLRLATARAISTKGFDVEAFAKVELPVWLCYALGGGRATKAAANSLAKSHSTWFSNTFDGWLDAGGNGAAMRIQPHVWAAHDLENPASYLVDVLRNSICTHANVTGLFGAAFHAAALATAMRKQAIPRPEEMKTLLDITRHAPELLQSDAEIAEFWLPQWNRSTGREFSNAWHMAYVQTKDACEVAAQVVQDAEIKHDTTSSEANTHTSVAYSTLLQRLELFDERQRGAGILTAVASLALGWIEPRPDRAVVIAANAIGSDTDTIGTMAGAILGTTVSQGPEGPLLDVELIQQTANRMVDVAESTPAPGHLYPDLLTWLPPRTQADALSEGPRCLIVRGLGEVGRVVAEPIPAPTGDAAWQWLQLVSGQTLLIKRRHAVPHLPDDSTSTRETAVHGRRHNRDHVMSKTQEEEASQHRSNQRVPGNGHQPSTLELDVILDWVEKRQYRDADVGYAVRRVMDEGSGEQLIALVTALRERRRQARQSKLFD
jgi:ADP-ribosylglycohydrolase